MSSLPPEAASDPRIRICLIARPDFRLFRIGLRGLSPLMVHRWSEKARGQIERTQAQESVIGRREKRNPQQDFKGSLYVHPDGGYGFPGSAFRLAAISACRTVHGINMTQARILFNVTDDLVKLEAPAPTMDTRMARVDNGNPDIRYRGVFWPWATEITISYNARAIDPEQIVNLIAIAGEAVGVGEYRPERGGSHGRFTLKA